MSIASDVLNTVFTFSGKRRRTRQLLRQTAEPFPELVYKVGGVSCRSFSAMGLSLKQSGQIAEGNVDAVTEN